MDPYLKDLLAALHDRPLDKAELTKLKLILARQHGGAAPPADYDLLLAASEEERAGLEPYLRSKPMRTASGVAVIAVMSKPGRCPHGTCTMCPGGLGSAFGDVPQSYTGHEPATLRGIRNRYDAYLQVMNRLEQYHCLGHSAQKAEVIVMGGTFLAFSKAYKECFIGDIYRALNDFSRLFYDSAGPNQPQVEPLHNHGSTDKGDVLRTLEASWHAERARSAFACPAPVGAEHARDATSLCTPSGECRSSPESAQGEKLVGAGDVQENTHGDHTFQFDMAAFKAFFELPGVVGSAERVKSVHAKLVALKQKNMQPLEEAQIANETAAIRCVGLTIETKPDWGFASHGREMLRYGVTRVEVGLQSVYDDVLLRINRGHTAADNKRSVLELKDLGFKINAHIMPGLPAVDEERDLAGFRAFFDDAAYRPDMVKVYPCMVMPGTELEKDYKAGCFNPLSTQEAAQRIAAFKAHIPPYCRVMRIQRDIPAKYSVGGLDKNNLRQLVADIMRKEGTECKCIRCREIGRRPHGEVHYEVLEYDASGGKELFFQALATPLVTDGLGPVGNLAAGRRAPAARSGTTPQGVRSNLPVAGRWAEPNTTPGPAPVADSAEQAHGPGGASALGRGTRFESGDDCLVGFLRLRYSSQSLSPEITPPTAIVRELHVYGAAEPLGQAGEVQHRGIGKTLLQMAEAQAKADGRDKMVVISGVGVREYYRKRGYEREGPYMVKTI